MFGSELSAALDGPAIAVLVMATAHLTQDGDPVEVVAAVAGKRIRLLTMAVSIVGSWIEPAAPVLRLYSNETQQAELWCGCNPTTMGFNPAGWFETAAGEALFAGCTEVDFNLAITYAAVD